MTARPVYEGVECDIYLLRPADGVFISRDLKLSYEVETKVLDPMKEI